MNRGTTRSKNRDVAWRGVLLRLVLVLAVLPMALRTQAQTSTIRFNAVVKGGVAMIGNSHYLQSSDFDIPDPSIVNDVDGDPATSISTSSDLILPANSTIVYAYLTVETGFESTPGDMTSVKFQVPGGSYITLTNASTQFLAVRSVNDPGTRKYRQMIFDVTDLAPTTGYVSVAGGGAAGRYFVADPIPNYPVDQRSNMGGWSLIVVYQNASSINRSVVVADDWRFFDSNGESVDTDIPNVRMPNSGTVEATVGLTGTYGDPALAGYCPACNDYLSFGIAGGALTDLADPVAGTTADVLNSTIGWASNNDVSTDGGPAISGSYTARSPSTGFTPANYAPVGSQGPRSTTPTSSRPVACSRRTGRSAPCVCGNGRWEAIGWFRVRTSYPWRPWWPTWNWALLRRPSWMAERPRTHTPSTIPSLSRRPDRVELHEYPAFRDRHRPCAERNDNLWWNPDRCDRQQPGWSFPGWT